MASRAAAPDAGRAELDAWPLADEGPRAPGRVLRVLGLALVVGRDDPGRLYWLTQAFVWLWYVNVLVVLLLAVGGERRFGAALAWAGIEAAVGFLATTLLREWYRPWRRPVRLPVARRTAPWGVAYACLAGGAFWALVAWGLTGTLVPFPPVPTPAFPLVSFPELTRVGAILRVLVDTLLCVVWSVGWLASEARREARVARARALAATAALEQARFAALRYQVNPHFLFNALTALQGLVGEDAGRAERMVGALARYLRYTLLPGGAPGGSAIGGAAPDALVPLDEELAALEAYLAVEQVRFEDRLAVTIAVAAPARAVLVPPLLLQPLVENAVRHGAPDVGGVRRLRIAGHLDGEGTLHVVIANSIATSIATSIADEAPDGAGAGGAPDGAGRAAAAEATPGVGERPTPDAGGPGMGVGLANVRARLAVAFPGRGALTLAAHGGEMVASLSIRPAAGATGDRRAGRRGRGGDGGERTDDGASAAVAAATVATVAG